MKFDYVIDPKSIEEQSFKRIRQLANLSEFDHNAQQVAMRIIHSCGMPDVAQYLRFSAHACERGIEALTLNKPILCDVEMVKQGITKRFIQTPPLCFLNHPEVSQRAKDQGETRTMSALHFWKEDLEDSVVLIGNAPTALFRLMELIESGFPKPALIIGMPVGFIGAEESKQALWECHQQLGVECITLFGKLEGKTGRASWRGGV